MHSSFFCLPNCSAPSQSKGTASKECFSTQEVYLLRGVELQSLKRYDRGTELLPFLHSQSSIQTIHQTETEYLLRWLYFMFVCTFAVWKNYLQTFLLFFDTLMISSAAQIHFLKKLFTIHSYMKVGNSQSRFAIVLRVALTEGELLFAK